MPAESTTFVVHCHYVYSCCVLSRRTRALDAAIDLVGSEGLRALTHARVDQRAGLPKGSTSNYYRTRDSLVSGVADRILEREMSGVDMALAPASASELVDAFCARLDHTTQANRTLTTARLVLFMEAPHDPALRQGVSRGRAAMAAAVIPACARLGARDPVHAAEAIMACFEGLILHRIARGDDSDPRPVFELLVGAALSDRR